MPRPGVEAAWPCSSCHTGSKQLILCHIELLQPHCSETTEAGLCSNSHCALIVPGVPAVIRKVETHDQHDVNPFLWALALGPWSRC